ncbi:MAG TPA: hypothetical protein VHN55_03720 [Sphingomicrobium sp.]|nr:hypothetical protein [Sphingomicrobium sp.]
MRARAVMIAVGLTFASAAVAEPPRTPAREVDQTAEKEKPVVLAAADDPRLQASEPQEESKTPAAAPARRARVTTCRCGDQNPGN